MIKYLCTTHVFAQIRTLAQKGFYILATNEPSRHCDFCQLTANRDLGREIFVLEIGG